MSRALRIHRAGPSLTVQDFGRIGFLEFGLSLAIFGSTLIFHKLYLLMEASDDLSTIFTKRRILRRLSWC